MTKLISATGIIATIFAAAVLATASPALAATTIGQAGTPINNFWRGSDELINPGATVPAAGSITSFHTHSSSCKTPAFHGIYDFQALRPEGNSQYLVLGHTGNHADPCDGKTHSYSVKIPVQPGDVLGAYVVSPWDGVLSGGSYVNWDQSEPAVGQTISILSPESGFHLDESATLQTTIDRIAEANSVVSTTSTSYVNLGGPSLTVNITKAGTLVTIWAYAQTKQAPAIPGATSWIRFVDNGSPILSTWYDDTNLGWSQGLWAGPDSAGGNPPYNITMDLGTFMPSIGVHTYRILYRDDQTGHTVSWRYRTLDLRVGTSTAPPPDLTHPTTP